MKKTIRKIALAYSGGLDTSIIIPWRKEHYADAEIIGVCVDVGQEEDWKAVKKKASASGASKLYILDKREEFVRDYIFPMLRAGAVYEGKYLLGTSIARPLQAKEIAEIAIKEKADAVAHGCTGKGNDQVRFELTFKAIAPNLEVIAPWRLWDIRSREAAIDYAQKHNIPLGKISKKNIYSRDWNVLHMSHEGDDLEDPWNRPKEDLFLLTKSPQEAPDKETEITIDFTEGIPSALNGKKLSPFEMFVELNKVGGKNGIGRADVVETRVVGMKSRGVYESPAATILHSALRVLEMLTMDADLLSYKRMMAIRYSELVYSGKWFSPLRESMDAFMATGARFTTGSVRIALYKGNIIIAGRQSPYSLYLKDLASFGESSYDHADASGFIKLYGLSTSVTAMVHRKLSAKADQAREITGIAATFHEK